MLVMVCPPFRKAHMYFFRFFLRRIPGFSRAIGGFAPVGASIDA